MCPFADDEESNDHEKPSKSAMHTAQTLFPSTMCSAFVEVIQLLDDHAVSLDGVAVYEIAYQVTTFLAFRHPETQLKICQPKKNSV